MRVTQYQGGYRIHRDHWSEWLWFKVSYEARWKGLPIPKWYSISKKINSDPIDIWTYYFIPILPIAILVVCFSKWLNKHWYLTARWFRIHNMLDKEEGARCQKFWPAYLHWPTKKDEQQ